MGEVHSNYSGGLFPSLLDRAALSGTVWSWVSGPWPWHPACRLSVLDLIAQYSLALWMIKGRLKVAVQLTTPVGGRYSTMFPVSCPSSLCGDKLKRKSHKRDASESTLHKNIESFAIWELFFVITPYNSDYPDTEYRKVPIPMFKTGGHCLKNLYSFF